MSAMLGLRESIVCIHVYECLCKAEGGCLCINIYKTYKQKSKPIYIPYSTNASLISRGPSLHKMTWQGKHKDIARNNPPKSQVSEIRGDNCPKE